MKRFTTLLMTFLLASCFLMGCDDGGGDGDSENSGGDATVDVSGTWMGTLSVAGESESGTIELTQNGNVVSGVDADGVNYTGRVSGNRLELQATQSQGSNVVSVDLSGTVEGNRATLTGTSEGTVNGLSLSFPTTLELTRQ